MSRTTPKPFQLEAIESGLQIFAECKRLLGVPYWNIREIE